MKLLLILLFFVLGTGAKGQTISGIVADSSGKPITGVTVTLKREGLILSYKSTNDNGYYSFGVPGTLNYDKLFIEVRIIGYKTEQRRISSEISAYNFRLSESAHQLETVNVKNIRPVITVMGDTLSYRTSDFSNKSDRVIGDVIKRLPGIAVGEDGKITFNGKAISNLYIDGDDLLNDRYNIATRSVPSEIIDKIQVLQNHQPMKVMKDRVVSENVAINLTVKDGAKLKIIGNETLGGGLPEKYFADLNAMAFTKKYKGINYFKANNASVDLQQELLRHNNADYLKRIDNVKPSPVLNTTSALPMGLDKEKYLRNQSALFNINNLVNLKKDEQLKVNANSFLDRQYREISSSTEIAIPTGDIKYVDGETSNTKSTNANISLDYVVNKDHLYLRNNLILDRAGSVSRSDINNRVNFNQRLDNRQLDITNEFNVIRYNKSNDIIEVYSYLNRVNSRQNSLYTPAIYKDLFRQNSQEDRITQAVEVPSFFTNNYISYKRPSGKLTTAFKLGALYNSQDLRSQLEPGFADTGIDSSRNDLSWKRTKIYTEVSVDFVAEKFRLSLQLPVNYQQLEVADPSFDYRSNLKRVFVNPSLLIKYLVGEESDFSLTFNRRNDIGSIGELYRGYILTTYRSINANDGKIAQQNNTIAALRYSYRKTISMFFANFLVAYSKTENNNIKSQVYFQNFQRNMLIPLENSYDSWIFNLKLSKYVFPLHTTVTSQISYQLSKSFQLQQNILIPIRSRVPNLELGTESSFSKKISLSLKASFSSYQSKYQGIEAISTQQYRYKMVFSHTLTDNVSYMLSNSFFSYVQTNSKTFNYNFTDIGLRYRFSNSRFELEGSLNNLFNVRFYQTQSLSELTRISTTYLLPGRIALVKINFSL